MICFTPFLILTSTKLHCEVNKISQFYRCKTKIKKWDVSPGANDEHLNYSDQQYSFRKELVRNKYIWDFKNASELTYLSCLLVMRFKTLCVDAQQKILIAFE